MFVEKSYFGAMMDRLRINWEVVAFFIFYFFVLQLVNDWQYRSFLDGGNAWVTFRYRLVTMPVHAAYYYVFFTWATPYLFKRRYGPFFFSMLLFIIGQEVLALLFAYPATSLRIHDFPHQSLHFTFINLFVVTGFAYFLARHRDEKIRQQLKEQHLQLELRYLKAQLHPHFFFNTMNNIYSLALYGSEKTAPMVEQLSQMMRYIIYEGQKDEVPLSMEVAFLSSFVGLERIRHDGEVSISFTVEGSVDGLTIAPLLFIPLLENGFKHGFQDAAPWLEAAMLVEHGEIVFSVKNSVARVATGGESGIGLDTLRKRLALLYPDRHRLMIERTDAQFEVSLTLQMS